MKSAYELAMERLEKESPSGPSLTDEQKAQLAEIDSKYKAKIAEVKILAEQDLKQAATMEEIETIKERQQTDTRRLESECEEKKNEARQQNK